MNNLAEKRWLTSAATEHGLVVARSEKDYEVQTGDGLVRARRAVGCLVEPVVDDLVLISLGEHGPGYILCVLEREDESETTLTFETNVLIRSKAGRIGLSAKQGLDLASEQELQMVSAKLNVAAGEGDIQINKVSFWGSLFRGQIQTIKVLADSIESFCRRFTRTAHQSYRQVDETDQVCCGRLHYEADSLLEMKGEYAKLSAQEDVHIGGERINIG